MATVHNAVDGFDDPARPTAGRRADKDRVIGRFFDEADQRGYVRDRGIALTPLVGELWDDPAFGPGFLAAVRRALRADECDAWAGLRAAARGRVTIWPDDDLTA
jgi:hypothetical protein